MTDILVEIHGREVGLGPRGELIVRSGVIAAGKVFASLAALQAAHPAASNAGASAYTSDAGHVVSNGRYWGLVSSERLLGPAPTRLISVGDSISIDDSAIGASTAANMYMARLKSRFPALSFLKTAVSGVEHTRYLSLANSQISLSSSDLILGCLGLNTLRSLGPNPYFIAELRMPFEGMFAWWATPESAKVRAVVAGSTTLNSAVTTTGTWAYFAASSGANTSLRQLAMRSSTSGATATFTPTQAGDTVYVFYFRSTLSETFRITVDGVQYDVGGAVAYSTWLAATNDSGQARDNWELCVLRIGGLLQGTHSVVVTHTAGGATPAATIAGVAVFNSTSIRSSAPAVCIGNTIYLNAAGYALSGWTANDPAAQNGGVVLSSGTVTNAPYWHGHAGTDVMNAMLRQAVDNLASDGLRIDLVDVARLHRFAAGIAVDNIHPNDGQHALIFHEFDKVITPIAQT